MPMEKTKEVSSITIPKVFLGSQHTSNRIYVTLFYCICISMFDKGLRWYVLHPA